MANARQPSHTIFIGNIPFDVTEQQLTEIFEEVGPVRSMRIVTDRETGKPKGFGFCEYYDLQTAESAFRNLSGFEISGRNLRVDYADDHQVGRERRDYKGPGLPSTLPDGEKVGQPLASMSRVQMYHILAQMKGLVQKDRNQARQLLLDNPQLTKALFQAQVLLGMVYVPNAGEPQGLPPQGAPLLGGLGMPGGFTFQQQGPPINAGGLPGAFGNPLDPQQGMNPAIFPNALNPLGPTLGGPMAGTGPQGPQMPLNPGPQGPQGHPPGMPFLPPPPPPRNAMIPPQLGPPQPGMPFNPTPGPQLNQFAQLQPLPQQQGPMVPASGPPSILNPPHMMVGGPQGPPMQVPTISGAPPQPGLQLPAMSLQQSQHPGQNLVPQQQGVPLLPMPGQPLLPGNLMGQPPQLQPTGQPGLPPQCQPMLQTPQQLQAQQLPHVSSQQMLSMPGVQSTPPHSQGGPSTQTQQASQGAPAAQQAQQPPTSQPAPANIQQQGPQQLQGPMGSATGPHATPSGPQAATAQGGTPAVALNVEQQQEVLRQLLALTPDQIRQLNEPMREQVMAIRRRFGMS